MVYAVYADEAGYVFDWDWIEEDPDRPGYPLGPLHERFEREIHQPPECALDLPAGLEPGRFDPSEACYSSRGDCLFCYITDDESFAVRINPDLTVFQKFGSNQHTGFKIKNIRRILQVDQSIIVSDPPGLKVSVTTVLLETLRRHPTGRVHVYEVLIEALYRNLTGPPKLPALPARDS